jgi:hypothetical protein
MYQVPSEFIRQKTFIVWRVTVEHAIAAFLGYLLGEALGGGTLVTVVCVALGLVVTTVKVQGLTLYRFVPFLVAYALRRIRGPAIEPEEGPTTLPQAILTIRDAEGNPIVYQES